MARSKDGQQRNLSEKQKKFAHEYLVDMCAKDAALRAGYAKSRAKSTGCNLLKDPRIQKIVQAAAKKQQKKACVDAAYVLAGAKRMFERCMQEEPVLDSDGNVTGEYQFDSAGAGKALKIMGDHVAVNAFKGEDGDGNPIDNNWVVTFVDATPNDSKKT